MSVANPIPLPLYRGVNKYGRVAIPKFWSGGNNTSKTRLAGRLYIGGDGELHGSAQLPETLDNSATVTLRAVLSLPAAGAGGQKVRLEFSYRALDHGASEGGDFASWQESVAQSVDVAAWSSKALQRVAFSLTQGNFSANDWIEYVLRRYPAHADDNYENSVDVHGIHLLASY